MAIKKKKVTKSPARAKKIVHRHFRPSYDAHPVFHLAAGILILTLIYAILSFWIFANFS